MDYRSNIEAVRHVHDEILPRVRAAFPDARFRIVGSNPAPEVVRLQKTAGVSVTGRVPDVRPELLSCAVSVAPLSLGRGIPNKILEALALTLPVVTTSAAAVGLRLDEFDGTDVADDPGAFADAVVRRLRSARAGQARYPQHRRVLEESYSWRHHLDEFRGIVFSGSRVR